MDSQTKAGGRGTKKTIIVEPFGGHGGVAWDDGSFTGVREIILVYDLCIDSIRVEYDDNGKSFLAERHGGNGGSFQANINLEDPEEILTSINGHYAPLVNGGTPVIRSLTFKSNKRSFGPYGMQVGTPFNFQIGHGVIVGFRGRSGWYLDAIGFCLSPLRSPGFGQNILQKLKKLCTKSLGSSRA